ncbi:Golgin subfamily A member 7/ERF4 family-domain-containing protein [Amylostereum chailletii]|nr:Golgin subfamily A member 7/ERF4 family-domain-containing protein [Amylostereum chailletii]
MTVSPINMDAPVPSSPRHPTSDPPSPPSITIDITADTTPYEHHEAPEEPSGPRTPVNLPQPPSTDHGVRILGVNYFPSREANGTGAGEKEETEEGLEEEEEEDVGELRIQHPLRLDIQPPSPPPWEAHDDGYAVTRHDWQSSKPESSFRKKPPPDRIIPRSSYYFGPPPPDNAFGTDPIGQLGVHHPREIVRVERDYSGGEVVQFAPTYPLELEGRITPTQFLETINAFNEILISAHSLRRSFVDNVLDIFTLHISKLVLSSHYEKEMRRLKQTMEAYNAELYNPAGLNILWPQRVGFLFLEVEYY